MSFESNAKGEGTGIEVDSSAVEKPKIHATQNEVNPTAQFSLKRKRDVTDISATDIEGNGPPAVKKAKIHADQKVLSTIPHSLKRMREGYESVTSPDFKGKEEEAVPPVVKKLKVAAPKDEASSPKPPSPPKNLLSLMQYPILAALMLRLTDEDAVKLLILNSDFCAAVKTNAPNNDVREWAGQPTCQKVTGHMLAGHPRRSLCGSLIYTHRCKGLAVPFTAVPQEQHRRPNLCNSHHDEVSKEFSPMIYELASTAKQGLCDGCEEKYWRRYQRSGKEAWTCGCGDAFPFDNRCRACYVDLVKQMEEKFVENTAEVGAEGYVKCFCGKEHENHAQWRVYGCYICRRVNVTDLENEG